MSLKIYIHNSIENLSAVSSRETVAVRCILTILMLFVAAIGKASDADVERLIKSFDGRHNQVAIANSLFKQLKSQHFIDEDIVFTSSTLWTQYVRRSIIGQANGIATDKITSMPSNTGLKLYHSIMEAAKPRQIV